MKKLLVRTQIVICWILVGMGCTQQQSAPAQVVESSNENRELAFGPERQPYFLIVQAPPPISEAYLAAAAPLIAESGGQLLATVPAEDVELLEPRTPAAGILVALFDTREAIRDFWSSDHHKLAAQLLKPEEGALAISVRGLPFEGLPEKMEIPTTASVTPPEGRGPRHFMLIQGSVTDQTRIDQYRGIILPMLKEQGAYYILFEAQGNLEFLLGSTPYDIIAISRWPDYAAGHAFWDSDRYQNTAIPARTGAGNYWVHFFAGVDG